jgi:hypothetical protein
MPPRVTFRKRSLRSALAFAVLLAPAPALAYETFPGAMQEKLGMQCPPSCLLCHTRIEGGKGHVKDSEDSFVGNLRRVGRAEPNRILITGDDADQFKLLLDKYATEPCFPGTPPCSSDGDPTSDIEELRANTDPDSLRGELPDCVQYGCGAHIAPQASAHVGSSSAGAVCALLGALFMFGRRARRRSGA